MEEDQEVKHACKLCSKSFPCGRSLGGHMRSHVITTNNNLSSSTEPDDKEKLSPTAATATANNNTGYGLRENPKKTWRIADSTSTEENDLLVNGKFCKECGRGFHSWKALFGHMKCHSASDKDRALCSINNLDDQDSWNNNNSHAHKLVMDSQSDNEATAAAATAAAAPSKRRRSKRRTRRYMIASSSAAATATATTTTTSSAVSSFANPYSSSTASISEVEQEQEEVAMSLMMLSRDVTPWSGAFHSESSDYNYFEAPSSSVRTNLVTRIDGKNKHAFNDSEVGRVINQSDKNWGFGSSVSANLKGKRSSELLAETGFRMNRTGFSVNGFIKGERFDMSELDYLSALGESEAGNVKSRVNNGTESGSSKLAAAAATSKHSSIKAKFSDSELKLNSLKNCVNKPEFSKKIHKRGKFECTTCNKIFHSYQALGGHRASHKKTKGCFANTGVEENELSPDPKTTESSKLMKHDETENLVEHELPLPLDDAAGLDNESDYTPKKEKVHECPICLRVFSSGQALGGHKRSHMAGGSDARNSHTIVLPEPAVEPEIRKFLDLNLPAAADADADAAEEEESNSINADSNRPWWVLQGSHKQEAMVGLMS